MKALLIAASLCANLVIAGIVAFRPAVLPVAFRDFFSVGSSKLSAASDSPSRRVVNPGKNESAAAPLWATLRADDLHGLVARLKAAGFPIYAIRAIVQNQLDARYGVRMRELSQADVTAPFWKPTPYPGMDSQRMAEYSRLAREQSALAKELLGDFVFQDDGNVASADVRRYGNLPQSKIDALQRIESDYLELDREVRLAMSGITLPEDRDKLALLEREKRADLAATLTPEELADYEMRSSSITNQLRPAMALFNPTEAEFKAIYSIQQSFGSAVDPGMRLSTMTPEERRNFMQNRDSALGEMEDQIRNVLGADRYADYARSNDRDYQQLSQLAEKGNLPAGAAIQAFNLRNQVSQESTRIYEDATMDYNQKLAAYKALVQNARFQFLTALGPTAGETYLKSAGSWLTNVENGGAVTFTSNGRSFRGLPNPDFAGGVIRTMVSSGGVSGGAGGPVIIGNGGFIYTSSNTTTIESKSPAAPTLPAPVR